MPPIPCERRGTILKATNVSLTLNHNRILKDLNLEICDLYRPGYVTGQVVGLLGPSGIGKTRLFRILAGMDAPDCGSVLIGEKLAPVQRGMVGVVAQNYPLFEHRTIAGNLELAARSVVLNDTAATEK